MLTAVKGEQTCLQVCSKTLSREGTLNQHWKCSKTLELCHCEGTITRID